MRFLVLTVDYEIFGNGTGDVRRHMVEPTERMARICEGHGVPLTVFLEAEEYVAFERHARDLERAVGYDPARLIREQVADLARRGHDFQLHLHPQWHQARHEAGTWHLRYELETVDHLFETAAETSRYIGERKALLEALASTSDRSHRVMTYRAGAFSARPGQRLLAALADHAFEIESSVVKGLHREDPHYCLDYRDVQTPRRLWRVRSDVGVEEPDGSIWEIPIHSVMRRRYQQATFNRLRAKFSPKVPREQQSAMMRRFANPRHPFQMLKSLWEPAPIKLDFHNLSSGQLLRMIREADWRAEYGPLDVLVLIGHSKEHADDRVLDRFLGEVTKDPGLKVTTFAEIAQRLKAQQARSTAVTRLL